MRCYCSHSYRFICQALPSFLPSLVHSLAHKRKSPKTTLRKKTLQIRTIIIIIMTSTTFRIGNLKTNKVKESKVRRRLKEVREMSDSDSDSTSIKELHFWNLDITNAILKDIQKLLCRDGRRFRTIKLLKCTGDVSSVVTIICDYSSVTSTLVLSGSLDQPTLQAIHTGLSTNQSIQTLRILGAQWISTGPDDGRCRMTMVRTKQKCSLYVAPWTGTFLLNNVDR
jgi:hypothetical protein